MQWFHSHLNSCCAHLKECRAYVSKCFTQMNGHIKENLKKIIKIVKAVFGLINKGQLFLECPFGVIVWTKIPTIFFLRISALASNTRSNQKKSLVK